MPDNDHPVIGVPPGRAYLLHQINHHPGFSFPGHRHRAYLDLLLLIDGQAHHLIDGTEVRLAAGEVLVVRPPQRHTVLTGAGSFYNLAFRLSEWEDLATALATQGGAAVATAMRAPGILRWRLDDEAARRWAALLATLHLQQGSAADLLHLRSFLCGFLAEVLAPIQPLGVAATAPDWLHRLMEDLARSGEPWTLERLVRQSGYTHAYVCRSIRQHLGCTPRQLLHRHQLGLAERRLLFSNSPIAQIADAAGFANLSHFNRLFRAAYGATPRDWRRAHARPI
jgi:AraC family cel operon transcriptional repressor